MRFPFISAFLACLVFVASLPAADKPLVIELWPGKAHR